MRKLLTIMILATIVFMPVVAFAGSIPTVPTEGTPITLNTIEKLVYFIIQTLITIAGLVMVGAIVYAGFLMVTAGTDTAKFKNGQTILRQAVIGSLVILGTGVILSTIAAFVQEPLGIVQ